MSTVAGDITEIRAAHPQLGDVVFYPKSEEAFTLDPGGFMTNDEDAGIDGSGGGIYKKTRKRWSVEGVCRWDMNGANELEFYRALEESAEEADFTITSINGTVWGAKGMPVAGNQGDMGEGTFQLKIAGGGRCVKIIG